MELNVIFASRWTFPLGLASSKRHRYMVDYMNDHHIESHYLVLRHKDKSNNQNDGLYGICDYHDISAWFKTGKILTYLKIGKKWLFTWFKENKKNVVVCDTCIEVWDWPILYYAHKLGYKIVFDQVETYFNAKGTNLTIKARFHQWLSHSVSLNAYGWGDGSFVISEALKNENLKRLPNKPLILLPNSTPVLERQKKKTFGQPPTILYSGTYAPKDGVADLIRAFMKVREKGYDCRLILTGRGMPADMKVLKLIEGRDDVSYRGMVSDEELTDILLSCDILTMTRRNTVFSNCGFPFKLSEYLATGNAVLATNVSDVSHYVEHKKSVYLAQPDNVEDIANGIVFFLEDSERALQIGQNGLMVMKQFFSIEKVGRIFLSFLETI